jgi:type IX secretion system PorP/SprF family membrane protein
MNLRIVISLLCLSLWASGTRAQQEWLYTQFTMNLFDCNAAYAGQHETPSFAMRHRQQWTGIDGRPISTMVSGHLPVLKNKMGAGVRLLDERIGARQYTLASAALAYRLRLRHSTLNLALTMGASRIGVDWSKLNVLDTDDPQIALWPNARWAPFIGAAAFYARKNAYVGVEALQLNGANYQESDFVQRIQLKSVVGFHQKVRTDDQLQMALLGRWSSGGIWQAEGNITYLKNNRVGLGVGYRMQFGAMILAQLHFTSQLRMGLSYDFSTQSTQQLDDRSFELFCGYTMQGAKTKSVRYL